MFGFVVSESLPALGAMPWSEIFLSTEWFPSEMKLGVAALIAGSLLTVLLAMAIAVPLSFFAAVALVCFSSQGVRSFSKTLLEIFAGLPSILIGLFALIYIVPSLNQIAAPGTSWLAASLALTLILVPTLTVSLAAALDSAYLPLKSQIASLGISTETAVTQVLLPAARTEVRECLILSLSRGLGETLAVLMVAGNVVQIPNSLFAPLRTLNANIALEIPYATGLHRSALFLTGTLTFVLAMGLLFLSRWRKKV